MNLASLIQEERRYRAFWVLTKTEILRAALDFALPVAMGTTAIVWLALGLG
jgi:hypothetical protein